MHSDANVSREVADALLPLVREKADATAELPSAVVSKVLTSVEPRPKGGLDAFPGVCRGDWFAKALTVAVCLAADAVGATVAVVCVRLPDERWHLRSCRRLLLWLLVTTVVAVSNSVFVMEGDVRRVALGEAVARCSAGRLPQQVGKGGTANQSTRGNTAGGSKAS